MMEGLNLGACRRQLLHHAQFGANRFNICICIGSSPTHGQSKLPVTVAPSPSPRKIQLKHQQRIRQMLPQQQIKYIPKLCLFFCTSQYIFLMIHVSSLHCNFTSNNNNNNNSNSSYSISDDNDSKSYSYRGSDKSSEYERDVQPLNCL